jgi:TolA-binding protein
MPADIGRDAMTAPRQPMFRDFPLACRLVVFVALVSAVLVVSEPTARADADSDYGVALQFYKTQRWEQATPLWADFLSKYGNHPKAPLAKLYYGQSLIQLGRYQEARDVFREYAARFPNQPDLALARYRIAECSVFLNDLEAAEKELAAFLAQHPNHELAEWAFQYQGEVFAKKSQFDKAAVAFREVISRFKNGKLLDDAKFGLARCEERLAHPDQAIAIYKELAADPKGRFAAEAEFNIGTQYFDQSKYSEAIEAFAKVADAHPQHPLAGAAELHAGYVHLRLKEFPAAIKRFEAASKAPAQALTARYWIGVAQKETGEFPAAIATFTELDPQVKELKPLGQQVAFHRADSELRLQHFDDARQLFLEAARRDPEGELGDDSLYMATDAAVRAGQLPDAFRIYEQFRRTYPQSGLSLLEELVQGRALLAQGDLLEKTNLEVAQAKWTAAATTFTTVATKSNYPATVTLAKIQLARAKSRMRDYAGVVEVLTPIQAELSSDNVPREYSEALVLLGNSLIEIKQPEQAVTVLKIYQERAPGQKNASALSTLAVASAQLGRWPEAISAVGLLKADAAAKAELAFAASKVGDMAFEQQQWDTSAEMFKVIVDLGPDQPQYWQSLSDLGHAYINQEKWDDAAQTLSAVLKAESADAVLVSHIAYLYAYSKFKQAETLPADKMEPELVAAAAQFEQAYQKHALPAEAAAPTDEQLKVSFNAYLSARGAARSLARAGKADEADAWWKKAFDELARQPAASNAPLDGVLNEWAAMHNNVGNDVRADELFQRILKEFPNSRHAPVARLSMAQGAARNGSTEEAIRTFEELAASPAVAEDVRRTAVLWLMDISAQGRHWSKTLQTTLDFQKAYPEDEHRWYARYRQAEALIQLGVGATDGGAVEPGKGGEQIDEAIKLLAELKQNAATPLTPTSELKVSEEEWYPQVLMLLAEAYFRIRNHAAVEATVTGVRAVQPDAKYLYQLDEILARSLTAQAKFDEARAAYQRVVDSEDGKRTETAAKAQFHLADSYLFQRDYEAALREFFKVYVGYAYPDWQAMALYQAVKCDLEMKRPEQAAKSLETLKTEFPTSEYVQKAEELVKAVEEKTKPEAPTETPSKSDAGSDAADKGQI